MQIKIEKDFSLDVKNLREFCYKDYEYDGVDKVDIESKENVYYINAYDAKQGIIGTSRLMGCPMLFQNYYNITVNDNDFELGRLCIAGSNPYNKYRVLVEIAKHVIGLGLIIGTNNLYTGAKPPGDILYSTLAGFKKIDVAPAAYPPAINPEIIMLKLNLKEEYEKNGISKFKLTEDFLDSIKKQI